MKYATHSSILAIRSQSIPSTTPVPTPALPTVRALCHGQARVIKRNHHKPQTIEVG